MVFLAICRWIFKFHCATYPVLRFGLIRSSATWRVAAGVSAGLEGCAGSGGLVPMRVSLPEVELGKSVTACENAGVAPSTELVAAPTMRIDFCAALTVVALVTYARIQIKSGTLTAGTFSAFSLALLMLLEPLKRLVGIYNIFQQALGQAECAE